MVVLDQTRRNKLTSRMNEYTGLIKTILRVGYKPVPFLEAFPKKRALMLRHDVDFDVTLAEEMARHEHRMGVSSTFFFLLRSESYNLLEARNMEAVKRIRELGHVVSLHFDPRIYENISAGVQFECETFSRLFGPSPECISIHRPAAFYLQRDTPIGGVRHTYQSRYCEEARYFSDSRGTFRFGSPLDSEAFRQRISLHLLIHPIWWVTDQTSPTDALGSYLDSRIRRFQSHVAANCTPDQSVTGGNTETRKQHET